MNSPTATRIAAHSFPVLLAIAVTGCGSSTVPSATGTAPKPGQARDGPRLFTLGTTPSLRFTGPGLRGTVYVNAYPDKQPTSPDVYRLSGRPLRVQRITRTPQHRGIESLTATAGGMVVATDRADISEVMLVQPGARDGLGRRLGPGFSGTISPDGKLVAIQRRSPNASGQPTQLVVRPLAGGHTRVVLRRRSIPGDPAWLTHDRLVVPYTTDTNSQLVFDPGTRRQRIVHFRPGTLVASVAVSAGGAIAASDFAHHRVLLLDRRGRTHGRPLVGYFALSWSPDGRSLLAAHISGHELVILHPSTGRSTLIARLPHGEFSGAGAWLR